MRIISGRWRGTRLKPPTVDPLQPSKGFVREILFNWLAGDVAGSRVLDCFAGSGALAIEAVSRGACSAELWEIHPRLFPALRQTCARLAPEQFSVLSHNAYSRRVPLGQSCDIVFLDPPFVRGLYGLGDLIQSLHRHQRLRDGALIYLEQRETPQSIGEGLVLERQRQCGGVSISLWSWHAERAAQAL